MIRALPWLLLALCAAPALASPEAQTRTIVETDGSRTLIAEVEVQAPAAEVWSAISTRDGWRSWAVPLARTVEGEPDMIETSYDPSAAPGAPGTIRQLFVARIPGRLLAFRTVKAPEGFPDFDTYARVVSVIELEPRGDRTTFVRLSAHPYPDTEAGRRLIAFFERGNRASLDMLRRRFVEGPIDWSKEKLSK
jgi:uncharacterized protein YndB with AHSA1/START domain